MSRSEEDLQILFSRIQNEPELRAYLKQRHKVELQILRRFGVVSGATFIMGLSLVSNHSQTLKAEGISAVPVLLASCVLGGIAVGAVTTGLKRLPKVIDRYDMEYSQPEYQEPDEVWASPGVMAHWESVKQVFDHEV